MANIPSAISGTSSQTFFNGYFTQPVQVSEAVYQQVYGFFLDKTRDSSAAQSLSQAVLSLTYNNNLDPLTLIADFNKASNESDLKQLLVAFFNATKGATSKLGYNQTKGTNKFVNKNIVE
jgi:hypothetical protein